MRIRGASTRARLPRSERWVECGLHDVGAVPSRDAQYLVEVLLNARTTAPDSDALERRPREEEHLLAHIGEAHPRLGLVARAFDVDDDTLAELLVAHVVA